MIAWIRKGRVVVSADGRWRVAHMVHGWELLDRGVVMGSGYCRAETAMNKAENEVLVEQRRRQAHHAEGVHA